jgi:hypothetical protein
MEPPLAYGWVIKHFKVQFFKPERIGKSRSLLIRPQVLKANKQGE